MTNYRQKLISATNVADFNKLIEENQRPNCQVVPGTLVITSTIVQEDGGAWNGYKKHDVIKYLYSAIIETP